jgi:hypothetical protein
LMCTSPLTSRCFHDMLLCMRTTININDALLQSAKVQAAKTNRTLTAVIEDALRLALGKKPGQTPSRKIKIPTTGSGGLQPGVDLDDMSSVFDRMEGRS